MAMLKRAELPGGVTVRQETVTLASLGGEVIVRGRGLAETLLLEGLPHAEVKPDAPPAVEREQRIRHGAEVLAQALHLQVVLEDGEPMWSVEQWKWHGAVHPVEVLDLYKVAQRLSGADDEALAKN